MMAVPCRLATLTAGTGFSEGVMLEDLAHSASAVALTHRACGRFRERLPTNRAAKPEIFYHIVGHVARRLSKICNDLPTCALTLIRLLHSCLAK
jgi:hypothetical protein